MVAETQAHKLEPEQLHDFITAGHATFTVVNTQSGGRYTFKVMRPKDDDTHPLRFVRVLTGADNEGDYQYLGYLSVRTGLYTHGGHKSRIDAQAPSARCFRWVWERVVRGCLPPVVEVWHEGRCGRCGRTLTVPESVASGFGPECTKVLAHG